jgi:hypothetical protein
VLRVAASAAAVLLPVQADGRQLSRRTNGRAGPEAGAAAEAQLAIAVPTSIKAPE